MEQISQKFKFNLRSIFAILLVLAVLCFIGVPFMGVSAKLTSYVGLALGLLVMGAFWLPLFLSRMVLANNNAQEQDPVRAFPFIFLLLITGFVTNPSELIGSPDQLGYTHSFIVKLFSADRNVILGVVLGAIIIYFLVIIYYLLLKHRATGLTIILTIIAGALVSSVAYAPFSIGVLGGIITLVVTPISYRVQEAGWQFWRSLYWSLLLSFAYFLSVIFFSSFYSRLYHPMGIMEALRIALYNMLFTILLLRPIQYFMVRKKLEFIESGEINEVATGVPGTTPSV